MGNGHDDNALGQAQAAALVRAAVKNGLAPDRRHLDTAFGPILGAEIGSLIKRKEDAEAKEFARRISRRTAETQDRTPVADASIDLETAIRNAIAEAKIPGAAAKSANPPKSAEEIDPRAVLAEWAAKRRQLKGGSHPGYYIGAEQTDGSQPVYRRDEIPAAHR
ncbi:hypothetical protein ACFP51_20275 [Streptomyces pratens]|uniref:Uncharacterized protein n=1 Tax=Streptomyces pratens TaxID=887456 RepID=A0ABW1M8Q6_9ACTN